MKYLLFTWPWCQAVMSLAGAILVCPGKDSVLQDSWMIPTKAIPTDISDRADDDPVRRSVEENDGEYIFVSFPDSVAHADDKGVVYDYEGNCFVPCE